MVQDAGKGAVNGVVRGTAVAVTQAVLGANPLTAGIGLVAPDAVMLLTQKDQLSEAEYGKKSLEVVGKGALATALVCAGPIGWLGLAGFSIASAYSKANQQASRQPPHGLRAPESPLRSAGTRGRSSGDIRLPFSYEL